MCSLFEGAMRPAAAALFLLLSALLPARATAAGWHPVVQVADSNAVAAVEQTPPPEARGLRHAITVYGGRSSDSAFSSFYYKPWDVGFERTDLLAVAASTRLFRLYEHLDLELEAQVAKRFGNDDAWEFNAALFLRYDDFPWNDRVYTTLGLGVLGPSYATHISDLEVRKSGNDKGSKLLNFFSPEITLSPPDHPQLAFVLRLHHRSGVFGLFDGVSGGSNFLSLGARWRFR